jgi:hypothetical protein
MLRKPPVASSTPPRNQWAKLEGAITTVEGAYLLSGFGVQSASVPTGAVLVPSTAFYCRVLARNGIETFEGLVRTFTTAMLQAPTVEPASERLAASARGA